VLEHLAGDVLNFDLFRHPFDGVRVGPAQIAPRKVRIAALEFYPIKRRGATPGTADSSEAINVANKDTAGAVFKADHGGYSLQVRTPPAEC
jgi:hypothetical protein